MMAPETPENRRPIKSRSSGWATQTARALAAAGISANAISVASVGFALAAALALILAPVLGFWLYLVAALLCPLRLLANLFDGMVAVEHGKAMHTGPLYNEVPDRISDVVVIAALGYSASMLADGSVASGVMLGFIGDWAHLVGWLGAVAALLTAYVRELGRALGGPADFSWPLAKQQRMWVTVVVALSAFVLGIFVSPALASIALFGGSVVIAVGTALTVVRRLNRLAAFLRSAAER